MKKFKKLAAVMVAVVTLMATTINACAVEDWLYLAFNRGPITAEYYSANNWFSYYDSYKPNYLHVFTFSDVDRRIMEGNVVLTVDFGDLEKLWELCDSNKAYQFMGSLYLKDKNGKFITEGKYPLTANDYGPDGTLNVMVDTNYRVFPEFNMTQVYYVAYGNTDTLTIHYKFNGMYVLPSYHIELVEISSASTPARFSGDFVNNTCGDATINRKSVAMTVGSYDIKIPSKYRGKSFYVYANGWKLGKVTLPYESTSKVSYTNY